MDGPPDIDMLDTEADMNAANDMNDSFPATNATDAPQIEHNAPLGTDRQASPGATGSSANCQLRGWPTPRVTRLADLHSMPADGLRSTAERTALPPSPPQIPASTDSVQADILCTATLDLLPRVVQMIRSQQMELAAAQNEAQQSKAELHRLKIEAIAHERESERQRFQMEKLALEKLGVQKVSQTYVSQE